MGSQQAVQRDGLACSMLHATVFFFESHALAAQGGSATPLDDRHVTRASRRARRAICCEGVDGSDSADAPGAVCLGVYEMLCW
jgi:hypothetical protein